MSSIFASIVLGMFVGLFLILIYEAFIYFRDKYKSYKAYKHSDKRTFDCSEIVWFRNHKFEITNYEWCDKTMHIFLTLKPKEFPLNYKEGKLDSRHVKKVVRVYALLGEVNE